MQRSSTRLVIEVSSPVVYDESTMMNIKNARIWLAFFVVAVGVIFFAGEHRVMADAGGVLLQNKCDNSEDKAAFAASEAIPDASYNMYVRLGKPGQSAMVDVYATGATTGECKMLGRSMARSDTWTEIAVYSDSIKDRTIFQLYSAQLNDEIDANRPSIMLVDQASRVCLPNPECRVSVNGEVGTVVPASTLLSQSSLKLVRVVDPALNDVTEVRYYVDDELAYTKPRLEAFDLRYVLYGGKKLSRVIEYSSGQLVLFETVAPEGYVSPPQDYLFRLFHSTSGLITGFAWLLVFTTAVTVMRAAAHFVQKRRQWRYDHGLAKRPEASLIGEERRKFYELRHIAHILHMVMVWLLLGTGFTMFMIVLNLYLIRVYKVDGSSMETTIHNGSWQIVNRIPKTLSYINHLEYIPKRGEVIVVDAVYGITNKATAKGQAQTIIKRVIGLPGERVLVRDGIIKIFNSEHPEGFVPDENASWADSMRPTTAKENIDLTLKAGELFVMGDNRPGSIDSRYNGPIRARNIVGPLLVQPN